MACLSEAGGHYMYLTKDLVGLDHVCDDRVFYVRKAIMWPTPAYNWTQALTIANVNNCLVAL